MVPRQRDRLGTMLYAPSPSDLPSVKERKQCRLLVVQEVRVPDQGDWETGLHQELGIPG